MRDEGGLVDYRESSEDEYPIGVALLGLVGAMLLGFLAWLFTH